jgi:bifunctional UDP-N-acetylglucosamine pyrophosphorylase / glucosamine-1-phosphate N-acetyltransferase
MEPNVTVVILAAGLGTRMKSKQAKVLHQAGGLSLIEHVVNSASRIAPANRIFAVVGHQAERVRQTLDGRGIGFVEQIEQKGTGHALAICREQVEAFGGLLVVLYGDCPLLSAETIAELVRIQSESSAAATVITTELEDPTGYGRIVRDADGNVCLIVEQKAATPEQLAIREINSGIYCFSSELLWKHIDAIKPDNPAKEYYLTDIVELFRCAGHHVGIHRLADPGEVLGINTRVELAEVDAIFRQRKVRQLMLEGVTIRKPETVTIDAAVRVGIDTVIEPFAQILGATEIGEDCRIGASCVIQDSRIEAGVEILPFTCIGTSHIESGASIGPYARLRMQNHVAAGAHIGNFVELKKTRMGAGAKAGHLAYLGDSVIGENVNIGAGTITCNYDGIKKHATQIGAGAFVGSNSTLVAPVEIGAGSYIAAGSVITDPVPADSLALGRARQVVKPEWARKRREQKHDGC